MTWRQLCALLFVGVLLSVSGCSDQTPNTPSTITLSGTVLDPVTNKGVEGASVVVWDSESDEQLAQTQTDSSGTFTIVDLPQVRMYLQITAAGFQTTIREAFDPTNEESTTGSLKIVLQPVSNDPCCSGVLTVTVNDENKQPLKDALVKVWKNGIVHDKALTNASGMVVFDSLCAGEYGVDVTKKGYTDREFEFAVNENCEPVSKIVTMEKMPCCSGVLTLVVRDEQGNPIEGAKVLIRKGEKIISDPRTNSNGKIIEDGLCPGKYSYRVSKDGYNVQEGTFKIDEKCNPVTKEVNLGSEECCSGVLTVLVRDNQNTPVAGAKVKLWREGRVVETAISNSDGKAIFDGLCQGKYGVDVVKDRYQELEFGFYVNENCDPVTKEVILKEESCCSGVLTLVVRDEQGNPIEGAKVLIRKGEKIISDPRTNSEGKIIEDGLCPGKYSYRVSKDGYNVQEGTFKIDEKCNPVTKEVNLGSEECCSGVLTVSVVDTNDDPIEDATVKVFKGRKLFETASTNANGKALFDGLCEGEYSASVSKEGYNPREFEFQINQSCEPVSKKIELTQ